jgi:transcriptional regulator with XRE-family HTH domain
MIGDMIARIRKEKNMSKTELAEKTNINIGHLTHIEKGERSPSYKALKSICKALDVPYQPTLYTIDKSMDDVHKEYKLVNHISYQNVPAVNIEDFINCPASMASASMAIKINDDSMEPKLKKDSYAFLSLNMPLENKDLGLFHYKDKLIVRRFIIRKDDIALRAEKKEIEDICVTKDDDFYIIGKILGTNVD